MVRMTDLFKMAKAKIEEEKKHSLAEKKRLESSKNAPAPVKENLVKPAPPEEGISADGRVEFSEMMAGKIKESLLGKENIGQSAVKDSAVDMEETKKLYFEAVEIVKKAALAYETGQAIDINDEIIRIADKIVSNILLGSRSAIKLFHEVDTEEIRFYRYYHAVNVGMLSVALGVFYNYDESVLSDLAVSGLLHDLGLEKNKQIVDKPEKLSQSELKAVSKHPAETSLFVEKELNQAKEIVNAILQHHERKNGLGYPKALTGRHISELAMILGLVDIYAAMIHYRPYKKKMPSHQAIVDILTNGKKLFSKEAIKALVSCVGLYPVGSWVELNTGEIGKVVEGNFKFPLRPVINIIFDNYRNKLDEARRIDLEKDSLIYIKQSAAERDI